VTIVHVREQFVGRPGGPLHVDRRARQAVRRRSHRHRDARPRAGRRPAAGIGHDAPAARRAVPGRRRPVQRAGRDRRAKGRHDCL